MNTKNLSTVTTDLIASYGNTAKNVIHAYRVGNQRVVRYFDQRWENAIQRTGARLRSEVRNNALSAQKTLGGMYIKGVVATSDGAEVVVDKVVALAGKGVHQAAANATQFRKRTGVTALDTIAKAAVPAAIAVSRLAGKLEQGSSRLANSVAGKKSPVKVATVKRAAAGSKTAAASKPAARRARATA